MKLSGDVQNRRIADSGWRVRRIRPTDGAGKPGRRDVDQAAGNETQGPDPLTRPGHTGKPARKLGKQAEYTRRHERTPTCQSDALSVHSGRTVRKPGGGEMRANA